MGGPLDKEKCPTDRAAPPRMAQLADCGSPFRVGRRHTSGGGGVGDNGSG